MPKYNAKDTVRSGVPLGGMGAGKFEILPNGLLNAFTMMNNWSQPLSGNEDYPGLLGYHLGISTECPDRDGSSYKNKKKAFLLQTVPVRDLPTIRNIRYEGVFPKAKLIYEDPDLDVEVTLEVCSAWLPGNAKDSSLPAAFFKLHVKNPTSAPIHTGFLFMGRNVSGEWCVGRKNIVTEEGKVLHLEMANEDAAGRDPRRGSLRFSFEKDDWQLSYLESWNAVTKNFDFSPKTVALNAWDLFVRDGVLPNTRSSATARSENQELCGAVSARAVIPAGRTKTFAFMASWYFPGHSFGHRYESWFRDTQAVARYARSRRSHLEDRINKLHQLVFKLPFPEWFNDALMTNLYPFFSSSWYTRDGRFAFYEAPVVCPLMGTLDVGFYGSIPLSYFFPDLELSQITQFAKAQRSDGYVPHDLGKNRIDRPSNGTTFYFWKDLNPKFILMVYRDYLWSQDSAFLVKMYPHVKKALEWALKTDTDGNGLPDHEGADQTFDVWEFHGANPYVSGIFLAALLACEKMARLRKDAVFAAKCRTHFIRARQSFDRELWNGKYFGEPCMIAQLNGQWYADLLGLGTITDPKRIRKTLTTALKMSGGHSVFGMVNAVCSDGSLDISNEHSRNIWSGMNYAFASLGIARGLPLGDLLNQVNKVWDNMTRVQGSPWNQPDTVDSQTGRFVFGDSYYRNMAIWAIPIAHAMKDKRTAKVLAAMRSFSSTRRQ